MSTAECKPRLLHMGTLKVSKTSRLELSLFWFLLLLPLTIAAYAGFYYDPLPGRPADFAIFRTAAEIVRSGQGSKLYDIETQQATFQRVTGGRFTHFLVWNHHPAEALLYLPSAWTNYETGLRLSQCLNVILMSGLAFYTAGRLGPSPGRLLALMAVLMCGIPFFSSAITMGQNSLWVLVLVVLGLLAALDGRPRSAGAMLGVASVKFTVVLPLLAILWIMRLRRVAISGVAVSASLWLVSVLAFGPQILLSYGRFCLDVSQAEGRWGLYSELLWNFRGFSQKWIASPHYAMALTSFLGLLFAGVMRSSQRPQLVGLALLLATLFSPHLYRHDAVLYIGSALVLLVSSHAPQPNGAVAESPA